MSRASGRLTVLHLSDVHATAGGLLYDAVDGIERLRRVETYIRDAAITPEAIVVTGDLAQRGHRGAYPALRDAFARLADVAGVPVLTALGNHDDPVAARVLRGHGGGHHRVELVDDLRFVLLDSSPGELGDGQIAWLRRVLSVPHGVGTVVALHHAPLGSPMPALAEAGLRDAAAFLDAVEGTDVRAVLAGHFHHPLSATLRGIPISVGPSLAYHQVMDAGPDRVSGHDLAMFSLVHLLPDGLIVTNVGLDSPAPIFSSLLTR
ncbi:metallophosphoesterase [Microbacterium oleivorans]|uniref:Metallophosphoesterase n=1 Tax=Microbacterium oleivorans TaxID=273677 RepID=A0A7D5EY91_9MICO|nr:metallophosphoesterase [Microbacterium oleivorans]QLD11688.1 metallophosphoesterase [Microbacterium oleivorans]